MDVEQGRDRLRELLDAVLDEEHRSLAEMADGAFASPFHFSRQLTRGAGEPPVSMKRRVLLERAAWQLQGGASVTDAAWAAGYESVEGFTRAFARAYGHPPSATPAGSHWLPAPNGIHFHPPMSLWVAAEAGPSDAVSWLMVQHDVDDTRDLLDAAKGVDAERYRAERLPDVRLVWFEEPERSLARLLERLVHTKEVWVASIAGHDVPPAAGDDVPALVERHERAAADWLAVLRDVERRDAWGDRVVDALCEPPESFVLASVVAHVLNWSALRRGLVRLLLHEDGAPAGDGDPIEWLRRQHR